MVETKRRGYPQVVGNQFLPSQAAESIENFYRDWLNRYLNFHRPCAFATLQPDKRGKLRKVYHEWSTPLEKLLSLPESERGLREEVSIDGLEKEAKAESDTQFAERLQAQRSRAAAGLQRLGDSLGTVAVHSALEPTGFGGSD